jgi:ArsR family transcriptional regulator, virulence genes transcriptional regulator
MDRAGMTENIDVKLFQLKADLCKAFSDPKRLIIINELRDGEKTVNELVANTNIPQSVISRELGILKGKGIVKPRRNGNNIFYSISDMRICEACDIIHQVLLNHLASNRELAGSLLNQ